MSKFAPTEAEDKQVVLQEAIDSAIASASAISVDRCEGWEGFTAEYRKQLHTALMILLEMREDLFE